MVDVAYERINGKGPHVSVDVVLFLRESVLLVQRKDGQWALPGGFVEPSEALSRAAERELGEETNIGWWFGSITPIVYDRVTRDSRSRIITHVFVDEYTWDEDDLGWCEPKTPKAGSDAQDAKWFLLREAYKLSLYADHNEILVDAVVARKK